MIKEMIKNSCMNIATIEKRSKIKKYKLNNYLLWKSSLNKKEKKQIIDFLLSYHDKRIEEIKAL